MLLKTEDAINFVARYMAKSTRDPMVLARINEAQRRLIVKGDWTHTIRKMTVITQNNSVTCPREVERILRVNIDKRPARVFPSAYQFFESGPGEVDVRDCVSKDLEDMGEGYPTFFDPPLDTPRKIFACSTSTSDIGKKIRIMGFKALNMDVRVAGSPGEEIPISYWTNGVEGSLDAAGLPALTNTEYITVSAVYKPITDGYVSLYCKDSDSMKMWFLGKYHPLETAPSYRRYRILGADMPRVANDDNFTCFNSVLCLVKLAAVPLYHNEDPLVIQNLDAIKCMIKAIEFENANNDDQSLKYEARAVRLLDEQLRNSQTIDNSLLQVEAADWNIGDGLNGV